MENFVYGRYIGQESKDFAMFKELAKSFPDKFYDFRDTPYGTVYDVINLSSNDNYYIIELKGRADNAETFPDCYIEMGKYLNLKKEFLDNPEHPTPLYINFIGNGDTIYIWDLRKPMTGTFYLNIPVKGHSEPQDRLGLQWDDATKLQRGADGKYKIVKKSQLI